MKQVYTASLLSLTMVMIGCHPVEQSARDSAAGLSGSIVAAQQRYQTTCTSNPSQEVCQVINRGVAAENALIAAVETYCGWTVAQAPPDPTAKCVPVKTAQQTLQVAIANANTLTTQIRGSIR